MTSPAPMCALAESYAEDSLLRIAMVLCLTACSSTVVLLAFVVAKRKYSKIAIHSNLKVLLLNATALYLLASATIVVAYSRHLFLFATYTDPCSLLVQPWINIVVRGVGYTYSISFPLWHLAVSAERAWATIRPAKYEKSGCAYGVIASTIVWFYSVGHVSYLLFLCYQDETFRSGSAFISLTAKTSASVILCTTYMILGFDILSLFVDLLITLVNRRHIRRIATQYSLGHSYQVCENVLVTTRLILPLDTSNAVLYIAAVGIGIMLREHRSLFDPHRFQALMELSAVITWLQPPVSLLIFMRFCKRAKRSTSVIERENESNVCFEQFRKQIGTLDARNTNSSST